MGTVPKLVVEEGKVYTASPIYLAKTGPVEEYAERPDYDWAAYERDGGEKGNNGHYPDKYKTPNHITFSKESTEHGGQYLGGKWVYPNDSSWRYDSREPFFVPSQFNQELYQPWDYAAYTDATGEKVLIPEFGPGGEYLKSYEPTRYVTYLPKAEDGVKMDGFVIDEPDREIEIEDYQSPFGLNDDIEDDYTPYQPVGVEYEQPDTNTFLEAPDISDSLKMVYDQDTAKVDSVKNQIMENTKVIQKNLADQGYYDRIVQDMNKNDIKSIQQKLIDSGYDLGKYGADGIFGPLTQKAWREFNIDGKAGNLTAKAQEYYMKENNIDKVVNNVYEDIKAVGNNGVEQVQESIVSNISKIPTYVENETGKSLIPKGNLFTKKETKRVLKGSDAIKNALRDIMPDISSWNGAVKDTLKDVFSWHNRNKIVDVSVGNIPLPANGANYVIGGGVALDNDDQVLETTTSQIDTKRFKFSSGDRDLTKLTPWHKDNTQCIVGLQRFMLDHNVNIDDFGVNGNFAWTILNKMVEKNNIGFYNIFAGADPSVGGSESKVKEYMSSKINTEEYQNAMSELNVGDVVTLYYKGSTFYGQAKRQTDKNNPTYTTHVGMIVEVDGQKQVWHNVHGTVLHVPLSAATGTKMPTYKGAIQVSGVVKLGGEDTQNYMDCSRFGVTEAEYFYDKDGNKTSLKSKERIFSPEAYRMYGALTPERDSLLLYNDNITDTKDFDYLVSLTCAEAYQETEYGRLAVIENDRLGIQSSLQQKLFKAGKNNLIPFRTTSDTLTNIKFDDKISDYELKLLGVYDLIRGDKHSYNEKETIMNSPEFSAQIGFQMVSRQSEVLDNLIDYAGLDPKFKAKTKENDFYTAMMALAWNQGITNKQTIGTLKKFSELYKTKGEEEAMTYLWSLIRDTKHLPHLSNVRQNVNAIDVNSDMAQSHGLMYSMPTITISGKGTESHDTYTDYLQTDNYYYLENNGENDGVYEEGDDKYDEKKTTNAMLYNKARKESTDRTTEEAIKIYNNYKVKY